MEEDKQYELYKKLMLLTLDDPNAIYNICMQVIISMSILNEDSTEEFEKTLAHMKSAFENAPSIEEVKVGARILSKLMGL